MFAAVGRGGLLLRALIFAAFVEAAHVWLTVIVVGRLRASFAAPATPSL